jgi:hypothetical protein
MAERVDMLHRFLTRMLLPRLFSEAGFFEFFGRAIFSGRG